MKIYAINPTLKIKEKNKGVFTLKWEDKKTKKKRFEKAAKEDLLSLKIISEDLAPEAAARIGNISADAVNSILRGSSKKGILIKEKSGIVRERKYFWDKPISTEERLIADIFTLQWHITNKCDLNCRHCYDRSKRSSMTMEQGKKILDELYSFCKAKKVDGHVCFTGGNPFLHGGFFDLYKHTKDRGFSASILGNPTTRKKLEKIVSIQKPTYFQVSLEGLEDHNDYMRGRGHFGKVMEFLGILKELEISSAVMLTLTADNIDHVLSLAELLENKTEHFTFNRLSQTGEGAKLNLPYKEKYISFLNRYIDSASKNKIIGFKDNLINMALEKRKKKLFDGCTGFGCGAAFNFITILPDGEIHACRKFPSLIGNIFESKITDVYESKAAKLYRQGPAACSNCRLRPACGGCMAVVHGQGLDVLKDRDPFCVKPFF